MSMNRACEDIDACLHDSRDPVTDIQVLHDARLIRFADRLNLHPQRPIRQLARIPELFEEAQQHQHPFPPFRSHHQRVDVSHKQHTTNHSKPRDSREARGIPVARGQPDHDEVPFRRTASIGFSHPGTGQGSIGVLGQRPSGQ
ncbi:hypothetical protein [Streptomyces sp. NBC_00576]|uniref:hypothetical protein n=1 Tax=Streptomyces sp. NBC_00576 TaxID=2903665 RepID=UPI002E81C6B5|nr:hypothetical protein [Streptomyces sp. NBC_00576]WUB70045.1 hypothetical protein OG734_08160 [Streptomyces sp. NBC_00576]